MEYAKFLPLFGAALDLIVLLVPIVGAIIWMLNQVFGKANPPPRPRPGGMQRPNLPQQRPVQPVGNVNDEIESFLRRAAQARAGQQAQPAPQPAAPAAKAAPRTLVASSQVQMPSRRAPELVSAELIDDEGPSYKGSVSQHVQKHLDTRAFSDRAAHMTKVDDADELMEGHLKQVFQHPVGSFQASAGGSVESESGKASSASTQVSARLPASELSVIFRDPTRIRQAFILTEILAPRDLR